jgi:hypothetical protein
MHLVLRLGAQSGLPLKPLQAARQARPSFSFPAAIAQAKCRPWDHMPQKTLWRKLLSPFGHFLFRDGKHWLQKNVYIVKRIIDSQNGAWGLWTNERRDQEFA